MATRLACRHRPHLAYLLWMLVIIKAITPPLVASPTGLFSWIKRDVVAEPVAMIADAAQSNPAALRPAIQRPATGANRQPAPLDGGFALDPLPVVPAEHTRQAIAAPPQPKPRPWPSTAAVLLAVWLAGTCASAGGWIKIRAGK